MALFVWLESSQAFFYQDGLSSLQNVIRIQPPLAGRLYPFQGIFPFANADEEAVTNLENQLTDMCSQHGAANLSIWDKVKRARAGVKATHRDDSSQYEMVGGTCLSKRKTGTRKVATPA